MRSTTLKKQPRAPPGYSAGDGDGQLGLAGPGVADRHGVAPMGEEVAGGEVAHQGFVDRCVVEHEVVDGAGERQLGDGDLAPDRAGLLLADLGVEEVADDTLRLMPTPLGGCDDLVEGDLAEFPLVERLQAGASTAGKPARRSAPHSSLPAGAV